MENVRELVERLEAMRSKIAELRKEFGAIAVSLTPIHDELEAIQSDLEELMGE